MSKLGKFVGKKVMVQVQGMLFMPMRHADGGVVPIVMKGPNGEPQPAVAQHISGEVVERDGCILLKYAPLADRPAMLTLVDDGIIAAVSLACEDRIQIIGG